MQTTIDQAKEVRKGEELNLQKLTPFLNDALNTSGEKITLQQFPSGFSNLTYLIKLGERELVLRRPPFGAEKISKGHDMGREYKVLSMLKKHYSKVPTPLVYTDNTEIIGAPFYVMERVKGIILRAGQKLDFSKEQMLSLGANFVDNLAELHKIDIEKTALIEIGKPEGYLKRQLKGWIKRYLNSKTDEIEAMEAIMEWLPKNMPQSPKATFLHNDYKYDNVVLDSKNPTQLKAVLDWEMATVGDPLTDLGTTLAYTTEVNDPPTLLNFNIKLIPGAFTRKQVLECYEKAKGKKVENIVFYYAFALFKLGVIAQQIYYRYRKGYTQDKRFARLIYLVKDCAKLSHKAIQENKISAF